MQATNITDNTIVEAVQWVATKESFDSIMALGCKWKPGRMEANEFYIDTNTGMVLVSEGDYVIKENAGNFVVVTAVGFSKWFEVPTIDLRKAVSTNSKDLSQTMPLGTVIRMTKAIDDKRHPLYNVCGWVNQYDPNSPNAVRIFMAGYYYPMWVAAEELIFIK